jgi:hypothetical protein
MLDLLHPELSNRIHDRLVSYGKTPDILDIDALIQSHSETLHVQRGYPTNLDYAPVESEVEDMVMDSFNYDPDYAQGEPMEGYREF